MDDEAQCHRVRLVVDWFLKLTMESVELASCSSFLNPIEGVWNALWSWVVARPRLPPTTRELETAILEMWERVLHYLSDNLVESKLFQYFVDLAVREKYKPYLYRIKF
ncbi:hypothetical protein AVEN_196877-1 [Araneus ventricosus]|uniref:Tc1-like transposase DDE domain-containing protein n=1 Tax=Araneus ventricosus TaxID=182803 RepID=A0A4Y2ECR3_ARAVE|nr:hypothetical protein AVEN_196877-1 [Araneus ventricosus]